MLFQTNCERFNIVSLVFTLSSSKHKSLVDDDERISLRKHASKKVYNIFAARVGSDSADFLPSSEKNEADDDTLNFIACVEGILDHHVKNITKLYYRSNLRRCK